MRNRIGKSFTWIFVGCIVVFGALNGNDVKWEFSKKGQIDSNNIEEIVTTNCPNISTGTVTNFAAWDNIFFDFPSSTTTTTTFANEIVTATYTSDCFEEENVSTSEYIADEAQVSTEPLTEYVEEEPENTQTNPPIQIESYVETTMVYEEAENPKPSPNTYYDLPIYYSLPEDIQKKVNDLEKQYNMSIGVGIYSLDMSTGYEYKADCYYNSACSLKASYACWVYQECDWVLDLYSETLPYGPEDHKEGGSGVIQNQGYGDYTIDSLLTNLTTWSDNDAWRVLQKKFSLGGFYDYNISIGGESDRVMWGQATPRQRANEWRAINEYITSASDNSYLMRLAVSDTPYCYMTWWTQNYSTYMHKSGWTEESTNYSAACDAGIIDNRYILVIMTRDDSSPDGRTDVVSSVGATAIDHFAWDYNLF